MLTFNSKLSRHDILDFFFLEKLPISENLLHGMKMDNFDYASDSLIPNLLDL